MKRASVKVRAGYDPIKGSTPSGHKEEREPLTRWQPADKDVNICLNCTEKTCKGNRNCYLKHGGK